MHILHRRNGSPHYISGCEESALLILNAALTGRTLQYMRYIRAGSVDEINLADGKECDMLYL